MKNIMIVSAVMAAMATPMVADNFDQSFAQVTLRSGDLKFKATTFGDELSSFETGVYGLRHSYGAWDANVYGALKFSQELNTLTAEIKYEAIAPATDNIDVYWSVAADYVTAANGGTQVDTWVAQPKVGALYAFNDSVAIYGETVYNWNLNNSEAAGGWVEFGVPVVLGGGRAFNDITLTPKIVTTFDVPNSTTNFGLEAEFRF